MIDDNEKNDQLIIDIQYFGTISYINTLFQFSNIEFEQYESYQKMSFRNRCMVAGSNGLVNLSVPLEKGRGQKELMKDVRISYSANWQIHHWRTLESCYSRSPFFEFYRDAVWELLQRKEIFLLDMNLATLEWLKKTLKIQTDITLTKEYQKKPASLILDLRNTLLPKRPSQISLPTYTQVFQDRIGFQPDLCVLDLLFCTGASASAILSKKYI